MQAGEATNTFYLCKHLADRGLEIHVLTSRGNGTGDDPRIHVYPIMDEWSWAEMLRMRTFFRRCAPDAVLLMYIGVMYKLHPMITFTPTLLKRMFPGISVVTRYESVFVGANPSSTSIAARLFRRGVVEWAGRDGVAYSSGTLLRDSDHVIVLCERHRTLLCEEWPAVEMKLEMIPPPPNLRIVESQNGVARQRGREKLGIEDDVFVIAFFGFIYKTKGLEYLLRAFHMVRERRKRLKLLCIGGKVGLNVEGSADYFEQMQQLADELGLHEEVIWTGPVKSDDEDGSLFLHAADVAVLPFLQGVQLNNSSLATVAAHGLPIIGTKGPLLDSAFADGQNILLAEPKDEQGIAEHLIQLMENPAMISILRAGVKKLAEQWFSWDMAIARTLKTLRIKTGSD